MMPTVCRSVHYWDHGAPPHDKSVVPRAAIVTSTKLEQPELGDGFVSLTVFRPNGIEQKSRVAFSPIPKIGCWSWPKQV